MALGVRRRLAKAIMDLDRPNSPAFDQLYDGIAMVIRGDSSRRWCWRNAKVAPV